MNQRTELRWALVAYLTWLFFVVVVGGCELVFFGYLVFALIRSWL